MLLRSPALRADRSVRISDADAAARTRSAFILIDMSARTMPRAAPTAAASRAGAAAPGAIAADGARPGDRSRKRRRTGAVRAPCAEPSVASSAGVCLPEPSQPQARVASPCTPPGGTGQLGDVCDDHSDEWLCTYPRHVLRTWPPGWFPLELVTLGPNFVGVSSAYGRRVTARSLLRAYTSDGQRSYSKVSFEACAPRGLAMQRIHELVAHCLEHGCDLHLLLGQTDAGRRRELRRRGQVCLA